MRGVLFNNFWPVDHEIISFLVKADMRVLVARPRDWEKVTCEWQAIALPSGNVLTMQPQASEQAWDAKYVQTRFHWALGIHKMPVIRSFGVQRFWEILKKNGRKVHFPKQ